MRDQRQRSRQDRRRLAEPWRGETLPAIGRRRRPRRATAAGSGGRKWRHLAAAGGSARVGGRWSSGGRCCGSPRVPSTERSLHTTKMATTAKTIVGISSCISGSSLGRPSRRARHGPPLVRTLRPIWLGDWVWASPTCFAAAAMVSTGGEDGEERVERVCDNRRRRGGGLGPGARQCGGERGAQGRRLGPRRGGAQRAHREANEPAPARSGTRAIGGRRRGH